MNDHKLNSVLVWITIKSTLYFAYYMVEDHYCTINEFHFQISAHLFWLLTSSSTKPYLSNSAFCGSLLPIHLTMMHMDADL